MSKPQLINDIESLETSMGNLSADALKVKSADGWSNDFNNVNVIGMYHIINTQSWSNKPPTIENVGNLIVMGGTNNNSLSKVQYFVPFNNTGVYIRTRGYGVAEWMGWKELSTTDKTFAVKASITPETNVNTLWATGVYTGLSFEGLPEGQGDKQGMIITYHYTGNASSFWSKQIFISPHSGGMWERHAVNAVWDDWKSGELYRTQPLTLLNAWLGNAICERVGNTVTVTGTINRTDNIDNSLLLYLPYTPKHRTFGVQNSWAFSLNAWGRDSQNGTKKKAVIYVGGSNGNEVWLSNASYHYGGSEPLNELSFSFSYICE